MITNYDYDAVQKITVRKSFDNGFEVGRGELIVNPSGSGDRPVGFIEKIFVIESHRHEGYGSQIIEELIVIARRMNCYKIILYCSDENMHFYEHLGFYKNQNVMRKDL